MASSKLKRKSREIEQLKSYLIVCEGTKTEPNYFLEFTSNAYASDVRVQGTGRNTKSLVEYACNLTQNNKYDEVWVVFDRDSFPAQNVIEAYNIALNKNINLAYTNEAFEFWYCLHFEYIDSRLSRKQYKPIITRNLISRGLISEKEKYKKMMRECIQY